MYLKGVLIVSKAHSKESPHLFVYNRVCAILQTRRSLRDDMPMGPLGTQSLGLGSCCIANDDSSGAPIPPSAKVTQRAPNVRCRRLVTVPSATTKQSTRQVYVPFAWQWFPSTILLIIEYTASRILASVFDRMCRIVSIGIHVSWLAYHHEQFTCQGILLDNQQSRRGPSRARAAASRC
jgi:hypothetical protein